MNPSAPVTRMRLFFKLIYRDGRESRWGTKKEGTPWNSLPRSSQRKRRVFGSAARKHLASPLQVLGKPRRFAYHDPGNSVPIAFTNLRAITSLLVIVGTGDETGVYMFSTTTIIIYFRSACTHPTSLLTSRQVRPIGPANSPISQTRKRSCSDSPGWLKLILSRTDLYK